MPNLRTKLAGSGPASPWGATDVSLREVIIGESGDATRCLCGDGKFRVYVPAPIAGEFWIGPYKLIGDAAGLRVITPDGKSHLLAK